MANITSYLESIKSAESGEVVRDSIVGALKKINSDNPTVVKPLNVTANGTYTGDGVAYGPVTVNVPGGTTSPVTLSTLQVTENGYYEAGEGEAYLGVEVNVPQTQAEMRAISINQNGEYDPEDDGYDGFSYIIVDVPQKGSGGPYTVTFHNTDGTVLQTIAGVPEGGGATYAGFVIPESPGMRFVGWSPNPTYVDFNMNCYPRFANMDLAEYMIAEDWETIARNIEKEGVDVGYEIGAWKLLDITGYGTVRMMLAAKGVDELEGLNGYAATTWIAKDLFNDTLERMNNTNTSVGGWEESALRSKLNTIFQNTFSQSLAKYIKPVVKYSKTLKNGIYISSNPTVDKLWIPSHREIFGNDSYENLGPFYDAAFGVNGVAQLSARIRKVYNNSRTDTQWWTRSGENNDSYRCMYIDSDGKEYSTLTSISKFICLGFCI